jgi:hypothetical protein
MTAISVELLEDLLNRLHSECSDAGGIAILDSLIRAVSSGSLSPPPVAQGEGLLLCPFCGRSISIISNRDWHRISAFDHADNCILADDIMPTFPATEEGMRDLIKSWNTRPTLARDPAIERDRLWCTAIVNTQYQSDCLKLNVAELLAEVDRLRALPPQQQQENAG